MKTSHDAFLYIFGPGSACAFVQCIVTPPTPARPSDDHGKPVDSSAADTEDPRFVEESLMALYVELLHILHGVSK